MDVRMPDGTVITGVPDDITQTELLRRYSAFTAQQKPTAPQQPAVPEERGVTGYLGDLGAAFGAGAGQAVAFPGQLLRLATKETEAGPIEQLGKRATEYWEAKKSETQRAKERAVEEKVNAAEEAGAGVLGQAGVAFGEVITDPALLSTYIAQSLPQVIGGSLVGIGVKGGTKLAARQVAAGAAKESVEQFATKAGVSAAVATAALMQGTDVGADTFDEAVAILKKQGYSEEDAKVKAIELGRKAATNATLASLAAQMLPGGRTIESALVRGGLGKGVISGAVKAGLIETPSEGLEEGSGAFFKNLALSEVDPTRRLSQGVGLQTGVGAAAGAGQGVVIGGIGGRRGATAEPKVSPKAEAAPEAKGKRSVEEAAIDALDQETVGERAVEEANQKFEEAALEDQQQPPMGGAAALEGTEQRTTGGAGVGVSVPQPPTEAPAATGAGVGRLAPTEGLAGEAVSREGQPAGALEGKLTFSKPKTPDSLYTPEATLRTKDATYSATGLSQSVSFDTPRSTKGSLAVNGITAKADRVSGETVVIGASSPQSGPVRVSIDNNYIELYAPNTENFVRLSRDDRKSEAVVRAAIGDDAVDVFLSGGEGTVVRAATAFIGEDLGPKFSYMASKFEENYATKEAKQDLTTKEQAGETAAGALTDEQINNLAGAGFTASQIESGVETVRYVRDGERNLQDVLLTPITRDHAAGLTSEEIAKKNKIDTVFARMLQVGLGLVPNERAKVAEAPAVETPVAETPAAETPAVAETPAAETPAAETPAAETPAAKLPAQDRFSDWQVITQEDDPNPFPEGMEFAVSAGAAGTLEFFKTKKEADNWLRQEIELQKTLTPTAETPAVETPAAEPIAISKREPVEAPKGVLRSKYTFSDGSTYQIEKRGEEFHLVGVPDENESYLGETRGEAERALNDDKNSGRLDQVVSKGKPGALLTQEQEPTILGLHPTVSQALRAGDLNGMLKAIANTTSGFYADLARRLAELNLPTIISTGTARARQLTRASIDLVSAPQQNRLFSYVQLTYPDLYNKYFQNYDAEANLERVYAGLKELKKILPETNRVSAEFSDVLQAYNDNIESIDPRTLGFYSSDFDEANIDIDRKGGTSNYVLLHEITHAATETLITRYENEPETLTAEQRAAAKNLKELYKYTKDNYPGDPETYGLRNIYEFVAEAFTNRGFQTKLKDMTYDLVRPVSVWSRFVKSILDLFGINTVAANVMMEANKLFSADRPRARKSIGPMFAKKQKNGPVSGGWRTAYDHNTSLIKLFQDAIRGRVPLSTALNKAAPVMWNTSAYLARQAYLGLAPLRELAIATKSKFPQLTGAIKLVEKIVAYRGQKMKLAEDIVKDWSKLQSERVQQSTLLGRVMLSATLQSQDPDAGNGTTALMSAWNALSPEAQSIYRRVRDFYANSVKEMIAEMKARARANMANDPAALKKALSDIDALFKGIKGPYFPLRRFGSFWFQVGTTDNDKEFYTFESMADRDFAMNERLEELQNGTKAEKALAETYKLGNSIGEIFDQNKDPTGVLGRVEDLIDSLTSTNPADVKKELKDSVHQLMYVLLPQQSMKKMFINRKGIQGASADMLRVFSDSAVHSAYQQARFKYSQDFLNNLTNAKDYIGEAQKAGLITPEQRAVYDEFIAEVGKRSGTILSTEDKRLSAKAAAAANQTTFFWMLTGPATAMLNVIGAAAFGIPDMGSKYGYTKTAALLTKNMAKYGASVPTRTIKPMLGKQFLAVDFPSMVEGGNLSPLQSMLAKAFIDAGDINISLTNALFEFGEQPSALYTGRTNTVKKFAAGLFHQAERFNREMVLMTSAELAYDKFLNEPIKDANGVIQRDASGKPLMRAKDATGFSQQAFDDALADAREVAGTALGDFSRAMKARAMQSPVGSVLFSMKSFALTASFFLMRNVDLSLNRPFRSDELADMRAALLAQKIAPGVVDQRIKEAQAELKSSYSEARRRMAGVMGITFLFGGLQAQPFFSLLLPALVAALKPDDDEEKDEFFNNENWFRNYMEINLGGYLGEMAMKLGMEEKTAKKVGREMGEAISGGIPAAAGVALTERVSIDPKDLWYRSGRFSPDYRETVMETIIANLGPAVGLGMNMVEAAQLMEEGRYQRAFERALPAIVSNPLKAVRLGKEGAVTKSGYTQVEEFTATELAMQALGFQPEVLAQKQKAAMEATTVKLQIQDRRNGVLDRLYLERDSEKGYEYALQMVDEYNEKYPYYPIKPKDIAESFKRKAKAAAEAHGIGMVMPKKMRGRLEPMVEYAKDEDED